MNSLVFSVLNKIPLYRINNGFEYIVVLQLIKYSRLANNFTVKVGAN